MHDGVDPGLDEDEAADQFVEVDVVVQGQDGGQAQVPQHGDGVAEDQHQDQHRVEQQRPTWSQNLTLNISLHSYLSVKYREYNVNSDFYT